MRLHSWSLLASLALVGCGEERSNLRRAVDREGAPSSGTLDASTHGGSAVESSGAQEDSGVVVHSVAALGALPPDFTLTVAAGEPAEQPATVTFIVDNSNSMSDDLLKLKESLKRLVDRLGALNLDYTLRFVPMSATLESMRGVYVKNGAARAISDGWFPDIAAVTRGQGLAAVLAEIDKLKVTAIHNEPGIASAIAHLRQARKEYGASAEPLHFVVLSDEENAREITTVDISTGSVSNAQPLFVPYQKIERSCAEPRKYDQTYKWDEYRYTYKHYDFRASYTAPGPCKRAGFQDGEYQNHLASRRTCEMPYYTCQVTIPRGRTTCGGTPALVREDENLSATHQACDVRRPKTLSCTVYVDGVAELRNYTKGTEPAGAMCTVVDYLDPVREFVLNARTSDPGVSNCSPCTHSSFTSTGPVDKTGMQVRLENIPLSSCTRKPYSAARFAAMDVTYGPDSRLLSVVEKTSCPTDYELQPDVGLDASIFFRWNVCDGELAGLTQPLPASVRKVVGTKSVETQEYRSVTLFVEDAAAARAAMAAQAPALPVENLSLVGSSSRDVLQVTYNAPWTNYPPELLNQTTFRPATVLPVTRTGTEGVDSIPSPVLAAGGTRVYRPTGRFEECVKYNEGSETVGLPSAEGFISQAQDILGDRRVAWHSIVNLDGKPCPGSVAAAVSEGRQYKELSRMSGGVVADVCAGSFDPFVDHLATQILYRPKARYEIAGAHADAIRRVFVEGQDRDLRPGDDYRIERGEKIEIVVDPSRIAIGDKIRIQTGVVVPSEP